MLEILISTTLKEIDQSLKRLSLGLGKILGTKNLSLRLRKQHQLSLSLERLRLIRFEKIRRKIAEITTESKTIGPKKALL